MFDEDIERERRAIEDRQNAERAKEEQAAAAFALAAGDFIRLGKEVSDGLQRHGVRPTRRPLFSPAFWILPRLGYWLNTEGQWLAAPSRRPATLRLDTKSFKISSYGDLTTFGSSDSISANRVWVSSSGDLVLRIPDGEGYDQWPTLRSEIARVIGIWVAHGGRDHWTYPPGTF